MKLDLINSRIGVNLGPRIYDSIEGDFIQSPPPSQKTIHRAAFKNKQKRLDYEPKKESVPDRFNVSVVDKFGSYIPADKTKRFRSIQSIPKNIPKTFFDEKDSFKPQTDPFGLDTFPSSIADIKKDHIYFVKEDSVQNRLASGRLPGAVWDVVGRKDSPPKNKVGPGDYEVYGGDINNRGRTVLRGGQFKTQPSGREDEVDPEYLPLKERKRFLRAKAHQDAKLERAMRSLSPLKTGGSLSSLGIQEGVPEEGSRVPLTKSHSAGPMSGSLGGAGKKDRFDDLIYKQESFVKTSGMTLSADWDKKLIKKIPFSFQPPAHVGKKSIRTAQANKSEGADVDVDVGHMFSIVKSAALSPVKYSAAFRSNAKVGMHIPVPTSGTEIGPGSFPGAHQGSIEIRQPGRPSHFVLRGRPPNVRNPIPDLTEPVLPFSEKHKSGPIFDKHVIGGGNVVLAGIVKDKMKQIYPRLAEQKFPPPLRIDVPSPWKVKKRK